MRIDEHISGLLYDHDCVIVPDFGGFVGNMRPARLDGARNRFYPPSKEVSFNRKLTNNDGLLANRIATTEEKSYEAANTEIRNFVRDITARLDNGQRVELTKVGTLYNDGQRNLRFEPNRTENYAREAFGLASFHAPAIKREQKEAKVAAVAVAAPPVEEREPAAAVAVVAPVRPPVVPVDVPPVAPATQTERRRKRRAIVWAPMLLLFLVVLYGAWITVDSRVFSGGGITTANMNPFYSPKYQKNNGLSDVAPFVDCGIPELSLLPDSVSTVDISFFDAGEDAYNGEELVTVKLREAARVSTRVATTTPDISWRFHVIGGCFRYLENAEGLVEELKDKGFNARIYDRHRGLYRVTYNSFASRSEALDGLAVVKGSENPGAWLLVK